MSNASKLETQRFAGAIGHHMPRARSIVGVPQQLLATLHWSVASYLDIEASLLWLKPIGSWSVWLSFATTEYSCSASPHLARILHLGAVACNASHLTFV